MNNTQELPKPREFPPERLAARRAALEAAIADAQRPSKRKRRGVVIIAISTAAVIGGGAAAARVILQPSPATDRSRVRCYTVVDLAGGNKFNGTEIGYAAPSGSNALPPADDAVGMCTPLWLQGLLRPGARNAQAPDVAGPHVVPPLTPCVLNSGVAAVFPAAKGVCQRLGLADLAQ